MSRPIREQLLKANEVLEMLDLYEWTPARRLADELDTCPKTIRRYVKDLRSLGHAIESAPGKGYRLNDEPAQETLRLTDEEVMVLFFSLCRAEEDFPRRSVAHLRRKLLRTLTERGQAQSNHLSTELTQGKTVFRDFGLLSNISRSFDKRRLLRLHYKV